MIITNNKTSAMIRKNSIVFVCILIFTQFAFSQVSQDRLHYIDKYKAIAQEEMERTGVPASIKLAQAILESNGGKSILSRKANNHFGIKCGGDWNDRSFYRVDDEKDKKGNPIESCFRVYKNPESSFIAHSEFLRNNKRYEFLFALDHKDYHAWAKGLKKAGYATNPKYPTLLISIIDNYELHQYDDLFEPGDSPMLASNDEDVMMEEIVKLDKKQKAASLKKQSIKKLNDISVIYALQDDTPETISIKTDIPLRRLFKYNESLTEPGQEIPENTVVFLQPKRKAFRGRKKFHKIKDGESIAQVSQKYGIRIDKLQKRNRLETYQEPLEGAILKIRGKRVPDNMLIPTREVFVAGESNRKQEVRKVEKYATSLSDFEAPQSVVETKEASTAKKKKNSFFNFGKKKNVVSSKRETTVPTDSYKVVPDYEEDIVEVTESKNTGVYAAPSSSDNYQSQDASPNATFKENTSIVVPSTPSTTSTTASNTYNTSPSNTTTYDNSTNNTTYSSSTSNTTGSNETNGSSTVISSMPSSTVTSSTPSPVVSAPQVVASQYHTVVKGETLYRLSKTYGKSVDYIKQVNNLNSNTISIGQKLIVN